MHPVPRESTAQTARQTDLRRMLESLKQQVQADLQAGVQRLRGGAASIQGSDVVDSAEFAEADIQDELNFSLIQMKAETLERIDDALARLDSGQFGLCLECGDELSERRLRALPFALRCTECEGARETRMTASRPARRFSAGLFEAQ